MQRSNSMQTLCAIVALVGLGAAAAAGAADSDPAGGQTVAGTWEHRHASFSYFGITSLYSCSGLETHIRGLLQHLGARKDMKVDARGCPYGYDTPGPTAIVELDFYTLVPSGDANTANVVQAHWTPIVVNSNKPSFMGHGDCELIEQMKGIISKNFSFRDLNYRTDCVPHEVNIDDFGIKAQALKALPAAASASRG